METWACYRCGISFERYRSQVKNPERPYCSKACANTERWAGHEKVAGRYTLLRHPHHALADARGLVAEHRWVLFEALGPGVHPCHHCGRLVAWRGRTRTSPDALVVDHLNGNTRDNAIENLVASCHTCNMRRRRDRVQDDEIFITRPNGNRVRGVERMCERCGETFVVAAAATKRGRARFCSTSCARRRG